MAIRIVPPGTARHPKEGLRFGTVPRPITRRNCYLATGTGAEHTARIVSSIEADHAAALS